MACGGINGLKVKDAATFKQPGNSMKTLKIRPRIGSPEWPTKRRGSHKISPLMRPRG
jgi:hypothetical protein